MKIITMKRIEDKHDHYGIDPDGEADWFAVIDTASEQVAFDRLTMYPRDDETCANWYTLDKMIQATESDASSDDDIFYYFSFGEQVPKVGEHWELDGLVFERIN